MPKLSPLLCLLFLTLTGCGQDLSFKVSYADIHGLKQGDAVVMDEQKIGKVAGFEQTDAGVHLVEVVINPESAQAATSEADFILESEPGNPQIKRIRIIPSSSGGKPIAEGEVVRGSYPNPLSSLPLGEIFRELGGALRDLRGQVERFRQEFQKIPDSPEAKRLQEEWRKLTDEIARAQSETGDTMKNEILPKLEKEMEELRKRLEEIQKAAPQKGKPLDT